MAFGKTAAKAVTMACNELIQQKTDHDCSICTLAMATDNSYELIYQFAIKYGAFDPKVGMKTEWRVLEEMGYKQMVHFRIMHRGVLAPEFFLHFSWRRRAILAVPSLNISDGYHSVYWDGKRLWDPCLKKIYKEWENLRPEEMMVFAE